MNTELLTHKVFDAGTWLLWPLQSQANHRSDSAETHAWWKERHILSSLTPSDTASPQHREFSLDMWHNFETITIQDTLVGWTASWRCLSPPTVGITKKLANRCLIFRQAISCKMNFILIRGNSTSVDLISLVIL